MSLRSGSARDAGRRAGVADPDRKTGREHDGEGDPRLNLEFERRAGAVDDEEAAKGRADQATGAPCRVDGGHDGASPLRLDHARVGVRRHIHDDVHEAEQKRTRCKKAEPWRKEMGVGRGRELSAIKGPEIRRVRPVPPIFDGRTPAAGMADKPPTAAANSTMRGARP